MNLYDYLISLGLKDSDIDCIKFLHFYIPFSSSTLLFKFSIFFPISAGVSALLKVRLFKYFNVSNLSVKVDLDAGIISLIPSEGIVGEIVCLTGV